jgi:arylsulfatase A-like enzyme
LGKSDARLPRLKQLYFESIRLTNFHVDPTCSPTRSALMTGRYSSRTGVWAPLWAIPFTGSGSKMRYSLGSTGSLSKARTPKTHS